MNKIFKYALVALPVAAGVQEAQASTCKPKKQADKRPNVLFIMLDDAGYGDFGCYGQTKTETPNIDALAASGVIFTDMYCSASLSSPSRCGLLTGMHTGHAQIRDNKEVAQTDYNHTWDYNYVYDHPEVEGQASIAAGTKTLGTEMQRAGYKTGMVGKWGIGGPTTEGAPWKSGFDFYYGIVCQRLAHNYYPLYLWRNDQKEYINETVINPGTPLDPGADPRDIRSYDKYSKGRTYAPDKLYENVISFVDENQDEPFFLMWTPPIPHSPLQAPQEWIDYYVEKFGDEEPLQSKWQVGVWPHNYYPARYPHATFAAMISYFDWQLGQVVAHLKELGIYDNTLIILTSDNGPANNASSPTVWFDSAAPYRCGKGWGKATMREGGLRMPFIASWPKKLKGGQTSDHMGSLVDMMPTFCELAGVDSPTTDGISMAPILSGKPRRQAEHEFLYWEFPSGGGRLAIRWGKWKGIVEKVNKGNRKMELYDISVPGKDIEKPENDVAAQHPEIVERFWEYIRASHELAEDDFFNLKIDPAIGL